ncbi:hypothetical protein Plhal304r1_c002g0005971 [Plasmopara halstedii]
MSPVSMTPKSPSLDGSDGEHEQSLTSSPALGAMSDSASAAPRGVYPGSMSTNSDTPFPAWDDEEDELHQRRDTSPARVLQTPCPFPDFSSTEARGVITNNLNEKQRRQLEADHKAALKRAHSRKGRGNLNITRLHHRAPARTDDELATPKALQARFLVPQEFPLETFRACLRTQRGGSRVPAMRTIPVVLIPGESATDDEALFERWVQRHQNLSSLHHLELSHKEVDVRTSDLSLPNSRHAVVFLQIVGLRHMAQGHCLSSAHGSSTSLAIAGKRGASDDAGCPDRSNQKRPRRLGKVAPQLPTSFQSRDIPATSQDIGSDPGDDDVLSRWRAVAGGDERVDRRPVTGDALQALEDKVLRNWSSAERHAEVAYHCADALDD